MKIEIADVEKSIRDQICVFDDKNIRAKYCLIGKHYYASLVKYGCKSLRSKCPQCGSDAVTDFRKIYGLTIILVPEFNDVLVLPDNNENTIRFFNL